MILENTVTFLCLYNMFLYHLKKEFFNLVNFQLLTPCTPTLTKGRNYWFQRKMSNLNVFYNMILYPVKERIFQFGQNPKISPPKFPLKYFFRKFQKTIFQYGPVEHCHQVSKF